MRFGRAPYHTFWIILFFSGLTSAWLGCTASPPAPNPPGNVDNGDGDQGDGTSGGDNANEADPLGDNQGDGGGDPADPDDPDGGDGGEGTQDPEIPDVDNPVDGGGTVEKGVYGQFRFSGTTSPAGQEVPGTVDVVGTVEGLEADTYQLMFIADDGGQAVADVEADGSFEVLLDENADYNVVLLEDGHFAAPAFETVEEEQLVDDGEGQIGGSEGDPAPDEVVLEYDGNSLNVASGPVDVAGEPLNVDENDVPVGVGEGVELVGLAEAADDITVVTDAVDADLDGIPAIFDVDGDGDGIIDSVDTSVTTEIAPPTGGDHVSGAFVFTNLKLDMDGVMTGSTADFPHNDQAIETIGWNENPAETPSGFAVQSVEIQDLPGWHRFGFSTTAADWTVAPGTATGYPGYPPSGSAWTGQLVQEGTGSPTWQVWVQAPKADATLASTYPNYVVAGESMPLNWDLSGGGFPTSNKIDYYRLKITYSDGTSTTVRYSPAASLFSYRTPPAPVSVTTTAGTSPVSISTAGGAGHKSNPITYPDASTAGDIEMEAVPPRFDTSGSGGAMHGTMQWRADVFYYDASGMQIGSVLTTPVPFNYTGAANPVVTVPEAVLLTTPTRTDMDGDGRDDFFNGGTDSSAIVAYKIDITAQPVTIGDNTGIFIYFVAESGAGSFGGFGP